MPRRGLGSPSEGRSPGLLAAPNYLFVSCNLRPNGPTVDFHSCGCFSSISTDFNKANSWPVGPDGKNTTNQCRVRSMFQGCALRWASCWAFGPNDFPRCARNKTGLHTLCTKPPNLSILHRPGWDQRACERRPTIISRKTRYGGTNHSYRSAPVVSL